MVLSSLGLNWGVIDLELKLIFWTIKSDILHKALVHCVLYVCCDIRLLERISWLEFCDVFYERYFSSTVRSQKKIGLQALVQGDISIAEYEARFITLERLTLGALPQRERERVGWEVCCRSEVESLVGCSSFCLCNKRYLKY